MLVHLHPDEAGHAQLRALDVVGECVELLSGIAGAAVNLDAHDQFRVVKHGEAAPLNAVVELDEGHAKANVGLVVAVETHGVVVGHARDVAHVQAVHIADHVL